MAAIPFLVSIDLAQNELLQAVLQNLATAPTTPTPKEGQLYFNTTVHKPYYYDGTSWIDFYGGIEEIIAGNALSFSQGTGTDAKVYLQVNVDESSITTGSNDTIQIKDDGVTTVKILNNNVTLGKIQSIGALSLLGNTGTGTANVFEVPIVTVLTANDTDIPTSKAVSDAISGAITALGTLVGDYSPTTTAAYPSTGSGTGSTIVKGDYWMITSVVSGTNDHVGTYTVNNGDVLYSKVDSPGSTDSNWFVVESNRSQATETVLGVSKIATDTIVNAGTNDTDYITALKLANRLATLGGLFNAHKKIFTITGDGTTTSFSLVHNLGTVNISVNITDASTNSIVLIYYTNTDTNTTTFLFNTAPASGVIYNITIVG